MREFRQESPLPSPVALSVAACLRVSVGLTVTILPIIPEGTPKKAVAELLRTNNAVLIKGEKGIIGIITPADLL